MNSSKKNFLFVLSVTLCMIMFILPGSAETVAPVEVIELSGYTLEDNMYYSGGAPGSSVASMIDGLVLTDTYEVYDGTTKITDTANAIVKTGLTIKNITDGTECTIVLKADINGDGNVTSTDYIFVKRAFSGAYNLTGAKFNAADFNSDNNISTADYMSVKRVFGGTNLYKHDNLVATKIDFDILKNKDISTYFTSPAYCTATFQTDSTEGGVIKLTTANVTSKNKVTPRVNFKYKLLVEDLGHTMPSNRYMVLKVKGDSSLWSRTFMVRGGATVTAARSATFDAAYIPDDTGWHYIMVYINTASSQMFDLVFESMAGGNGESVYISEIYLLGKNDALALAEDTVYYPVTTQTANNYKLKILNYNIQTDNGNSVPLDVRADMFREQVETLQPDSVGMQEVTNNWRTWLNTVVFNDSYAGVGIDRTTGGEANMIYYRKDKFQLVRAGTFWLSDTPTVAGSSFSGSEYVRICTWARLKDKTTGTEYVHLNTHLDTSSATMRNKQVQVILKYAIDNFDGLPMVFTGDFNQKSGGAFYKSVTGTTSFDGYTGPFADSRLDATVTVSADPIDYVFYTDAYMNATLYKRFSVTRSDYSLSDHPAIYTEFKMK